ncbi:MAG TPA: DUF2231 domain-containing protein [Actinomycetota bacterium]|jgi:uncharacterized membrane protein|nr:DUF2231 domain-containing protein [Actinomycetota bacterium]
MRLRDWTLREIAQGKPWGHPTHAMFIHFPTALYPVALVCGLISAVQSSADAARGAALLLGLGLAGTVPAVATGLLDWLGMVPGSTKRRTATRHMLYQLAAQALALVAFALHIRALGSPSPTAALFALAFGIAVMLAGNWIGGVLVYRMAMRVGGSREPAHPRRKLDDRALHEQPAEGQVRAHDRP